MMEGLIPGWGQKIFLLQNIQTSSGATQWLLGTLNIKLEQLGHEADRSSLSVAKIEWHHTFSSAVCLHDVDRDR